MATDAPNPKTVEEVQRLFLRHAGMLRGFILGLMPDRNRAEDVFQELFLTVTRKADDFESGTNFLAWARSIARLKVLEAFRGHKGGPALLGQEALEAVLATADQTEEDWEDKR